MSATALPLPLELTTPITLASELDTQLRESLGVCKYDSKMQIMMWYGGETESEQEGEPSDNTGVIDVNIDVQINAYHRVAFNDICAACYRRARNLFAKGPSLTSATLDNNEPASSRQQQLQVSAVHPCFAHRLEEAVVEALQSHRPVRQDLHHVVADAIGIGISRHQDGARKAGLGKVVKGLPDGIDTLVGAGFGGQIDLSGGQWQRLALARLIYQDAPVMILDEPVASLDPEGERAVFELFSHVAQARIIIFTTHRYDSIPQNTKIVVLVDGVIAESGMHEELLQQQREYWSLYVTATHSSFVKSPAMSWPRWWRQRSDAGC